MRVMGGATMHEHMGLDLTSNAMRRPMGNGTYYVRTANPRSAPPSTYFGKQRQLISLPTNVGSEYHFYCRLNQLLRTNRHFATVISIANGRRGRPGLRDWRV